MENEEHGSLVKGREEIGTLPNNKTKPNQTKESIQLHLKKSNNRRELCETFEDISNSAPSYMQKI